MSEAFDKYANPSTWADNKKEKITLVCTSLNPDKVLLNKMLDSAYQFDEIVLNIDQQKFEDRNDFGCPSKQIARVFNQDHWSIPDAYNWMIKEVKTEWICCFCDDDYFYPEGLAKMIAEIRKGCYAGIAHYKYKISGYRPPQDLRSWILGSTYDLCEKQYITEELLKKHNRLPAGSFFRKDVWKAIGGFKGDKCHDHNFWLRAAQFGFTFKYYDHLVYNHVRRENSAWVRQQTNK